MASRSDSSVNGIWLLLVLTPVALAFGRARGEPPDKKHDEISPAIYTPKDVKWSEAPPILPRGAQVAVLEGDPNKEGPFVMRVRLPDGYKVAPHTHPKPERVTVIQGTLYFGMGEKFEAAKCKEMPAGSFGTWPAGMKHFAWVKGETVLQLHGTGPWVMTYVNPDDDPRKAPK
jgi:quercetin dioxygenase-like cupin family protein